MYKLCFLFLGMKKRSNLPAFTDKLLVFQQHKTAVRLKYKNGSERRFCVALANHIFPKTSLYFIHVQQSFSSYSFLVLWGFLVLFWLFFNIWLLCNELGVCFINKNKQPSSVTSFPSKARSHHSTWWHSVFLVCTFHCISVYILHWNFKKQATEHKVK